MEIYGAYCASDTLIDENEFVIVDHNNGIFANMEHSEMIIYIEEPSEQ